jgi:hypothetical protein
MGSGETQSEGCHQTGITVQDRIGCGALMDFYRVEGREEAFGSGLETSGHRQL